MLAWLAMQTRHPVEASDAETKRVFMFRLAYYSDVGIISAKNTHEDHTWNHGSISGDQNRTLKLR